MSKKAFSEQRRLVTPEFRASYPHVFKPAQVNGKGEFKYSITMLFPKDGDLSALKLAIKHAKIDEFGPNKSDWPEDLQSPVIDGDDPKHKDKKTGKPKDGYAGHWVINAKSNEDIKPTVVDAQGKEILEASKFYAGCYARAFVFARVWEFGGEQGVHFVLDHVQKLRDGKPFGGRKTAQQVFTPVAGGMDDDDESIDDGDDDMDFTS